MTGNPTAPHTIIIYFRSEVREKMPSGELSGNISYSRPEPKGERWEIFKMEGQDKEIAIRKLNELITELRNKGFKND